MLIFGRLIIFKYMYIECGVCGLMDMVSDSFKAVEPHATHNVMLTQNVHISVSVVTLSKSVNPSCLVQLKSMKCSKKSQQYRSI